ncbi:MAG: asparagine synthase-related protein [Desulfobacterales bacterium]|jgi:hypothetical protein|nr:asparagine synthase-related protein [Desulfobacterales bacterium]
MSIAIVLLKAEENISHHMEALRNAIAPNSKQLLPCVYSLRQAVVGWVPGPEVFLFYENNDSRIGVTGRVVILGYAVAPGASAPGKLGQILLNAWRERGTAFLADVEGSFSLFMHDSQKEISLVATDPISSRPLWSTNTSYGTVISSDLRDVCHLFDGKLSIDKAYLWSFFSWAKTVGDHSPIDGVKGLEPGQAIEFKGDRVISKSYYTEPVFRPDFDRSTRETAEALVECMRHTLVDLCTGSRAPCLMLSGGLDSRLIAALCPDEMGAVTLCDRVNREVDIAHKIANRCGLKHSIIKRNIDWYPSLVAKASQGSSGLWSWLESHYTPLADMHDLFPYDVVTLGFGADTYFKGLLLKKDKRFWCDWRNRRGPKPNSDQILRLLMDTRQDNFLGYNVLRKEIHRECRDAYVEAASKEIEKCIRWANNLPDLWELYQTRSMVRVKEMLNLVCFRSFTSERNLFSSPRLRKLYLTIPSDTRAGGRLVLEALKIVGKGLASLPDASSWLPARFPGWMHNGALQCRGNLSRARGALLRISSSREVSGHGAWQRTDRLLDTSSDLQQIITNVIEDNEALPDSIFDRDVLIELWTKRTKNSAEKHMMLALLVSFGLFHNELISQSLEP